METGLDDRNALPTQLTSSKLSRKTSSITLVVLGLGLDLTVTPLVLSCYLLKVN